MNYKSILFCLFIGFAFNIQARTTLLDAKIVVNSKDTIYGRIISEVNYVYPDMIIESSFNVKLRLQAQDGSITKYKYDQVQWLEIIDLTGEKRVFVRKEGYPRLLELMYSNIVSFYKNYYWNSGNSTQDVSLELFNEHKEKYSIGIFSSKRGKLKKFSKGKEKTTAFVKENRMSDANIISALKLYESELKKKN
jgi:hypothetical protein